jgi:hypothetical protein
MCRRGVDSVTAARLLSVLLAQLQFGSKMPSISNTHSIPCSRDTRQFGITTQASAPAPQSTDLLSHTMDTSPIVPGQLPQSPLDDSWGDTQDFAFSVFNLIGGLSSWRQHVDPHFPNY